MYEFDFKLNQAIRRHMCVQSENSFHAYCFLRAKLLAAITADTFFVVINRRLRFAVDEVYRFSLNGAVVNADSAFNALAFIYYRLSVSAGDFWYNAESGFELIFISDNIKIGIAVFAD